MRLNIRGEYPPNWKEISNEVKAEACYRCVRCHHPFGAYGGVSVCDGRCDASKGFHVARGLVSPYHIELLDGINYGVHHFDGDKSNCRWWNLMPLCNSCHLTIQATVIPERPWLFEHSEWAKPYIAGFYSWYYGAGELPRGAVEAELDRWLAHGQPWRTPITNGDEPQERAS